ncbi:MAG: hypothetical protein CVU32_00575 [Betaproteobacteria bacterium HGW-Betaproteobacteria-5]|nr:MAG: hypothetical protein CVU32_00575 [Betaproteobacteria bacterium HGW-Betaproteobacteria-5]
MAFGCVEIFLQLAEIAFEPGLSLAMSIYQWPATWAGDRKASSMIAAFWTAYSGGALSLSRESLFGKIDLRGAGGAGLPVVCRVARMKYVI